MAQPGSPMVLTQQFSIIEGLQLETPAKASRVPSRRVRTEEDKASGDVSKLILELAPGGRVAAATATVSGTAFHGRIANLQGARVTASPVIRSDKANVEPTSTEQAFIVDFGRSISVLGLRLAEDGTISLVVPWMGTDFAPDAVHKGAGNDAALSGLETTKLLVQVKNCTATEATFAGLCTITTGTPPSNVRASLNDRLPFWTQPGPLDREVTLTGLAEDLNALLAAAEAPVAVMLALSSDTLGVLKLDFDEDGAEVELSAQARWGSRSSTDVALAALQPQIVAVPLVGDSTATWQINGLTAELTGEFPPWRAYPAPAAGAPGPLGLRVDATFSVARRLLVEQDVELHGVGLALRGGAAAAELHVELLAGADAPPQAAKPLAAAELTLAAGATGWQEVLFDGPVGLPAPSGGWLVVQAKTGAAEWAAAAEAPVAATATLGAAQGGRWERYPPVGGAVAVAQARLLRTPLPTENEPLLTIAWADLEGSAASADPGRERSAVELARPDGTLEASPATDHVLELSLTAATSGTLTLQRATALYREKTP